MRNRIIILSAIAILTSLCFSFIGVFLGMTRGLPLFFSALFTLVIFEGLSAPVIFFVTLSSLVGEMLWGTGSGVLLLSMYITLLLMVLVGRVVQIRPISAHLRLNPTQLMMSWGGIFLLTGICYVLFTFIHMPSRQLYGKEGGIYSIFKNTDTYLTVLIAVLFWFMAYLAERFLYLKSKNNIFNR